MMVAFQVRRSENHGRCRGLKGVHQFADTLRNEVGCPIRTTVIPHSRHNLPEAVIRPGLFGQVDVEFVGRALAESEHSAAGFNCTKAQL